MIVLVLLAAFGLLIGTLCYSGLWRAWTGPDGDRAWGLGLLFAGSGAAAILLGQVLGAVPPLRTALVVVGFVVLVFGGCSCYWMPPPLRPRWYRAQYTPLLRRRPRR